MAYTGLPVAFGGAAVGRSPFETPDELNKLFDALDAGGVKIIDTAQLYGESETLLGNAGAAKRFIIDTKAFGGFGPKFGMDPPTKDVIVQGGKSSLEKLKTSKVDIFYLHAPAPDHPIADTLAGINRLYESGAFTRFGVSNFKPEAVEEVYNHCKENNYVLPTVYQGNYSPVARKQEEVLFPTLRKLGIAFYAYSPLAGGFLTKTKEQIKEGAGRFQAGTMLGDLYLGLYSRPAYLDALEQWQKIAEKEGLSRGELAYRWVAYNSPLKPGNGDKIIVGASNLNQLNDTLTSLNKGPLSQSAVDGINGIWKTIEHEAPLDNYHG